MFYSHFTSLYIEYIAAQTKNSVKLWKVGAEPGRGDERRRDFNPVPGFFLSCFSMTSYGKISGENTGSKRPNQLTAGRHTLSCYWLHRLLFNDNLQRDDM